jgi:ribonuclease P protein component
MNRDGENVPSARFPRPRRILQAARFGEVLKGGFTAADGVLVLSLQANGLAWTRLGVTIPRGTGPAVVRNRWKRLIREAFRRQQDRFPVGMDLIVRPKRGALPDQWAIAASIVKLSRRAATACESAPRSSSDGPRP